MISVADIAAFADRVRVLDALATALAGASAAELRPAPDAKSADDPRREYAFRFASESAAQAFHTAAQAVAQVTVTQPKSPPATAPTSAPTATPRVPISYSVVTWTPPPPSAPEMPYRSQTITYQAGGLPAVERPTKVYPGGRNGGLLHGDELKMYRVVEWIEAERERLKTDVCPNDHDPTSQPPQPYRIEPRTEWNGRAFSGKVYPHGPGDLAGEEEMRVWTYLQHVRTECDALRKARPELAKAMPNAPESPVVRDASPTEPNTPAVVVGLPPITIVSDSQPDTAEDTPVAKRERATRELLADPTASNPVLAERARCSDELIRRVRHAMQADGRLQPVTAVVKADGSSYPITSAAVGVEKTGVGEAMPASGETV